MGPCCLHLLDAAKYFRARFRCGARSLAAGTFRRYGWTDTGQTDGRLARGPATRRGNVCNLLPRCCNGPAYGRGGLRSHARWRRTVRNCDSVPLRRRVCYRRTRGEACRQSHTGRNSPAGSVPRVALLAEIARSDGRYARRSGEAGVCFLGLERSEASLSRLIVDFRSVESQNRQEARRIANRRGPPRGGRCCRSAERTTTMK